jgi:hypothetical protein
VFSLVLVLLGLSRGVLRNSCEGFRYGHILFR